MCDISWATFSGLFRVKTEQACSGTELYTYGHDLDAFIALARFSRAQRVVEFGVQRGATAWAILNSVPTLDQYIGVDVTPDYRPPLACQRNEVPAAPGELALGDNRFRTLIRPGGTDGLYPAALMLTLGYPADFVIIDGDHSEAGVRRDTALARAIVRPGGVIAWHDFNNVPEVTRTIVEMNEAEGDRICHVDATAVCFEIRP